jgi:hypothetical protein
MRSHRSMPLGIATALLVVLSLSNLVMIGAPTGADGIPIVVVWGSAVLGIAGLVAAVGLWQLRRWGMGAALVVLGLNLLSAAPGLVAAPSTGFQVAATAGLVVSAVGLLLLLLPGSRRQYA